MPAVDVTIGVIILAAGGSRRLGTPKQMVSDPSGETLIARAARTALAAACGPVLVVLGASADTIRPALAGLPVTIAVNFDWERGMAASLQTGLAALGDADAALVMLCDQPAVTPALLGQMAETYRDTGHALVACDYGAVIGVPALFGPALFPALRALRGEEGARQVIKHYDGPRSLVPFPEGVWDIDTPADLAGLGSKLYAHE